jgi:hypothetical protein
MAAAAGDAAAPKAGGKAKRARAAKPAAAPRAGAAAVLPPALNSIFRLPTGVTAEAIPPADTGTNVSLRLDLADCQVDGVIAESYSGAALIVADLTQDPIFPSAVPPGTAVASAVVHGNRLRSRFLLGETGLVFALAEASVTGNVIANEVAFPAQPSQATPESWSLSLFEMAQPLGALAVAVSGNILIDPPSMPNAYQAWQALNTVVDYSEVPTVTGLSLTSGAATGGTISGPSGGGTGVTIAGTGFTAATTVNFGTAPGTAMTIVSDTEITVTSPAGTGTVDVTVITPAGTSATSAADQFAYFTLQ